MNNQVVTVNLVPGLSAPAVVRVSQYDYGRPIVFNILDGTQAATIGPSATITVVGTKPSGLGFSETALTISGGAVTLNTTLAMTQESGLIPAEIRIEKQGSGNVGTANFILAVEKTPHAEGTTDGTQESMQNLEARLQSEIDGLDDRIEALENAEESGLTNQEKSLILTLFSKAAYAEDDAKTAYDTLEGLWRVVYRTITYNLTNCISTSSVTSVESNKPYSTNLATQTGYTITSVTVTMGGQDVTAGVVSGGSIQIPQVTGDVVITAVATKELSSITATYTQSGTVYDTDTLDSLKPDLVVTANYSGGTSETVPASDYTLSGTLTAGTSTVTVTFGGKTTTFTVTVTSSAIYTMPNAPVTFNGSSDYIDTEIQLLSSDTAFTIFVDFTAGTYSSDSAILHCVKETGSYPGFFLGERTTSSTQYFRHAYYASGNATYFKAFDTNRHKYIITHQAGAAGVATWYMDSTTGSTTFGTNTLTYENITQTLLIGCYQNTSGTKGRFWNGTIHACKVWNSVLSADAIANLMGA